MTAEGLGYGPVAQGREGPVRTKSTVEGEAHNRTQGGASVSWALELKEGRPRQCPQTLGRVLADVCPP